MTVRINSTILGRSITWEFPGDSDLQRWSSQRPWLGRGGVLVAYVREAGDVPNALLAAEEEALRHSQGNSVRCISIRLPGSGESLKGAVGMLIGWSPDHGQLHFRERLRIQHEDIGACIYFVETDSQQDIDDAEQWVDICSKSDNGPAVCFVFVCLTKVATGIERTADFSAGWLSDKLLTTADDRDEGQLWNGYVVQRMVWECAGSPSLFGYMERSFLAMPHLSRTEQFLDSVLTRVALELKESRGAELGRLLANFTTVQGGQRGDKNTSLAEELQQLGMLWRPRHTSGWILPGWVARAIASEKSATDPWLLRRSVNCSPLAGEVVSLCTGLELKIRQQHLRHMVETNLPAQAVEKLVKWRAGHNEEFVFYSDSMTLQPPRPGAQWNDGWAFADLGDLEAALRQTKTDRLSRPLLEALGTLRRIRNAVAHGHPVCWNQIKELRITSDII